MSKAISERDEVLAIKRKLKHYTVARQSARWFDCGEPLLHEVLGDPIRGIPYGKLIQISGPPGVAKSGLMMELAAKALEDGAHVGWLDFEFAWDDAWATQRGFTDPKRVALFRPEVVRDKKNSEARLLSGEEVFSEARLWVEQKLAKDPEARIFLGTDSVPAILTQDDVEKGIEGHERRASLASFMTRLLKHWVPFAWTHNVLLVFVNQKRTAPGIAFGDPTYEPGGNALSHYSSVIVRARRAKGSKLIAKGRQVGIKGVLKNIKNKVGGLENSEIGYRFYFSKSARFMTKDELEAESA